MANILLEDVAYQIEETATGTWRRYMYENGRLFEEYTSHRRVFGLPFIHYTRGRCPETGKRIVAIGFIAIGRLAVGVIAIGHASAGIIAIGQLALGLVIGLGQVSTGLVAIGQLALAALFGLGQAATGYVAIGQFALGQYVLAQLGLGTHVWDMHGATPAAEQFFKSLIP